MIKFIRFWFPVIVYSGIIFCVSGIHGNELEFVGGFDKVLHIIQFIPFGYLLAGALVNTFDRSINIILIVTICSFLYGVSDEIHQMFVPGRDVSVLDIIFDTFGGFLGSLGVNLINKQTNKRN